jgi:hypothetical protein
VSERLDAVAQRFCDVEFSHSPVDATRTGIHDRDGDLDDLVERDGESRRIALHALRRELLAVEPVDLEEEVDRDALAAEIAHRLHTIEVERPLHRNPYYTAAEVVESVFPLFTYEGGTQAERVAAITSRLSQAPRMLAQGKTLLDEPCPGLWRRMAVTNAEGSAAFLRGRDLVDLAAGSGLESQLDEAREAAAAALDDFGGFLQTEHTERFPDSAPFALGPDELANRLRDVHCITASPAELIALGENEIATITAEMDELAGRIGEDGWRAGLAAVRRRTSTRETLVADYNTLLGEIAAFVFDNGYLTNPDPAAALGSVQATPDFQRKYLPLAAANVTGPFDPVQTGYVTVTPPQTDAGLGDHAYGLMHATAAHEGYPGHLLQCLTVNGNPSVLRKVIRSHMMIEGWAHYCESLLHTLGYYDDQARIGQLSMRLSSTWGC